MENVVVVFPKLDDGNKIKAVLVKNGINVDYLYNNGETCYPENLVVSIPLSSKAVIPQLIIFFISSLSF